MCTYGAVVIQELNVCSRIDGQTVVLVVDFCTGNSNIIGIPDVKGIGVVTQLVVIPILIINGDPSHDEFLTTADTETLNRGVLESYSGNRG